MHRDTQPFAAPAFEADAGTFEGFFEGYRFSVCQDAAAAAAALDVRRRVYIENSGYHVPVPDQYDHRSWFLLAEDVHTGAAIGSMRVTPRAEGPVETEEYFRLPQHLRSPRTFEVSRFAILPAHRTGKTFLPVVSFGLFKLVINFLDTMDAHFMVVCSKPERVWTFQWLRFERTGMIARYKKLANLEHELLVWDFRPGVARHRDFPFYRFFLEVAHPEIELPESTPPLDLASDVAA